MTFTIKSLMPTGKTSQTYGTEYYTQFSEHEQPFPLWFKKEPEIGTTIEGEVVNGKFKKAKKEWKPQESLSEKSSSPATPAVGRAPYKDNSLGMRIGMCINNAAAYVNTLEFPKALTDREWAETVVSYGKALFRLSDDSNFTQQEQAAEPTTLENVQAVFGGGEVVK